MYAIRSYYGNSQNPEINAGPKVLAGFTDAPVNGTATRWIKNTIPPMVNPCHPGDAFLCTAVMKITKTKKNVKIASIANPEEILLLIRSLGPL